jgi:DNA-binding MarR family transcriptional regulator
MAKYLASIAASEGVVKTTSETGLMGQSPETDREDALNELARASYRLSAADARLRGRATREPQALSLPHARALRALAERGPLTVKHLAEAVETTGAAVTQLVGGLERAGYVTRTRATTGDRRTALVALTDAGTQRHRARQQKLMQDLRDLLSDQSDEAVSASAEILTRLARLYDTL